MDRPCPNDVIKNDKCGTIFFWQDRKGKKVNSQLTSHDNSLEKDVSRNLQKKLTAVLKFKREIQIIKLREWPGLIFSYKKEAC